MRERFIIHLNVADFAVAVERTIDCRLQKRPVVIAPEGAVRATVYDMSEEAYQNGIRKGMALKRALRYCRDAVVLPPHPERYEQAMADFLKYALPYSPLVEATDLQGHLFLDVTGTGKLFGPPPDLAWRIRKHVRAHMGFDPIWSVAPNKLIAKVATRVVKPTGEYIVSTGEETAFLNPLPLYLIPGIETEDVKRFLDFNFTHTEQVVALSHTQLHVLFGKRSRDLYHAMRGIDPSPVLPALQKKPVVHADHTFGNDTNDTRCVTRALYGLVEKTGAGLRQRGMATGRMQFVLGYSDGKRVIRQVSIRPASAVDSCLFAAAKRTLRQAWKRRVRVRYLRLSCSRLTFPPPAQRMLFDRHEKKDRRKERLTPVLDTIRNRFGHSAVRFAFTLP